MLCSLATKAGAMSWRRGAQSGRGTGSEGGSDKTFEMVKVSVAVVGLVAAVAGSTAVAVHHLDQTEIKRIQDKAATEIAQAKADVARVEGERRLSEERLRAEVERYKYDLRLTQT
ncbi:hypothetical protein NSK_005201 [Nannochloropsis salina CCMP1776]|uniref:Uncharacterized protein n=1 Tax=Nannochloropsis salina CCMP1776 TaxID=1027361 RepID=A0A4D9CX05_9STRA|nr:hypothetical protein NSK_005201 [Nannochloropsis salina CCMP1776]|eukprot:TFJ83486.1 hypothetical protein NSK_005201 [Nannochloropsis salina CCMP1776]